ncbi:MAG: 30S ribosomal protein S5 [Candidatus Paceibacterota bacterium]
MVTEEKKENKEEKEDASTKEVVSPTLKDKKEAPRKRVFKRVSQRAGAGRGRKRQPRRDRVKSEFEQKIIGIRRVTRVVAGGRRFSFSVAMVIGDRNGRVGVGVGKAGDTALAIEKANRDARQNMITVKRTKENSLLHETQAKYCGSVVVMAPSPGKGLVAGSSVRNVLDLSGVTDVSTKILSRSKNKLNNAHAALAALAALS